MVSVKKRAWRDQRKPKQLKGLPLNPNIALEMRYYNAIATLIRAMSATVEAEVHKLFIDEPAQKFYAQDATISSQAKILTNALTSKFQKIFNLASKPLAQGMTAQADKSSATALKSSLKQLSGGLTLKTDAISGDIYDILNATVAENVALIKSISSDYLTQVQSAVMRSITTGNGLQDLVPFLQKQEGITLRRARVIARDQTRKAFSNLNFARMDKLGIKQYEWLHSAGSQKPRKLHIAMSGKIYDIANPPVIDNKTGQRGKPGDLINCKCRAIPIIVFDTGEQDEGQSTNR
jgi:SPP1 gp7 family putative phage head morphogenesis protein